MQAAASAVPVHRNRHGLAQSYLHAMPSAAHRAAPRPRSRHPGLSQAAEEAAAVVGAAEAVVVAAVERPAALAEAVVEPGADCLAEVLDAFPEAPQVLSAA